jgi:hypothetical protein
MRYAAAVVILLSVNPSLSFAQGHQGSSCNGTPDGGVCRGGGNKMRQVSCEGMEQVADARRAA